MGKKKRTVSSAAPVPPEEVKSTVDKKGNRNFVYTTSKGTAGGTQSQHDGGLQKVQLPTELESTLIDLILENAESRGSGRTISKRLSTKKLTDMYNCLSNTGFKHKQIEQAMSKSVAHGGDVMDALDWLCLNTPNDKLPPGFSQAFCEEENKKRPKFQAPITETSAQSNKTQTQRNPETSNAKTTVQITAGNKTSPSTGGNMKNWILQYADQDSEEESDKEPSGEFEFKTISEDPNEMYLELTAKLLDAKNEAFDAKQSNDKPRQREASQKIMSLSKRMAQIETHPAFDSQVKIKDVEIERPKKQKEEKSEPRAEIEGAVGGELDGGGFSMFDEPPPCAKPKPAEKKKAKLDKRDFAYTRQQWTGKSPKQFLIDWVRKHLPKSPPPSYHKVSAGGGTWKSKCTVKRPNEGDLTVCPEIVTANLKDAEHLASALALFNLCKGQRIYQLLPPPFRDAYIEWQDAEDKAKEDLKVEENKPRDQFVTRLMQKLKIDDDQNICQPITDTNSEETDNFGSEPDDEEDDVGDTWEDLLSDEDDDEPEQPAPSKHPRYVPPRPSKSAKANVTEILNKNKRNEQYARLLEVRQHLPVYASKAEVVTAVKNHQVLVVAGETGSGKSTQIPQFILEDALMSNKPCNIVCTEPRRISAMSLATRVSEELGEKGPGTKDSLCGYQIRFESKKCASTRLLYSTTGVLLRKLQLDTTLSDLTHIIVDEVHERSVQSDFLIIILRRLVKTRPNLRVILMSATLDSDKISGYFCHSPVLKIPGRTFPVEVHHVEDLIEHIDYSLEHDSPYALRYDVLVEEHSNKVAVTGKGGNQQKIDLTWSKDQIHTIDRSGLSAERYSLKTRNTVTRMDHDRINVDLVVDLLYHIDRDPEYSGIDGAALVFMPGLSHIQELYELLTSDRRFRDKSRYKIIPLHSVLSSQDQSQAFSVPPKGVRKIVIATNIAETGITIPDVVFVIDTGKAKENKYVETSQMSSLEEVFISRANAKQRQGRAGRVREGICFRLFTKAKYDSMKPFAIPEMLRVPLEELCLHIMKCKFGNPSHFLSEGLDPPQILAVNRAMTILREVGACTGGDEPTLTPLGHHLAAIPVNVRIGKMLVYSAILGCLEPMCIIAASMTDKSPFVVPMGKQDLANGAKQCLATENSDHLTLFKAFLGWKEAQKKGRQSDIEYCQKCFLKRNSMIEIENVSRDLMKVVQSVGFDHITTDVMLKKAKKKVKKDSANLGVINISNSNITFNLSSEQLTPSMTSVLKAVLTAGLYPRLGKVSYTAPVDAAANPTKEICIATTPQGPAALHPGSVNRFLAANGLVVYMEKVKTHKIYLRDATFVSPYPILLFGGSISVQHNDQVIAVDDWIKFKAFAKTAVIFKELRILIDDLLERKLSNPSLRIEDEPVVVSLLELIVTERQR